MSGVVPVKSDHSWDDEKPVAALESDGPEWDAFDSQAPLIDGTYDVTWMGYSQGDADRECRGVFFTVSTPSGTLSATATLGGRVERVEVKDVSRLDESCLAEEIIELASLARDRARAAQHAVTVELMGRRGQDRVNVSALLEHSVELPTDEATSERLARAFSERYGSDDD